MLNGKQRSALRALGHHLDPVVLVGKLGLNDALVAQVSEALAQHELIKVKVHRECPVDASDVATHLSASAKADIVQHVGRVLLFFRRNPKRPRIRLSASDAVRLEGPAVPKTPPRLPVSRSRPARRDTSTERDGSDPTVSRGAPRRPAPRRTSR